MTGGRTRRVQGIQMLSIASNNVTIEAAPIWEENIMCGNYCTCYRLIGTCQFNLVHQRQLRLCFSFPVLSCMIKSWKSELILIDSIYIGQIKFYDLISTPAFKGWTVIFGLPELSMIPKSCGPYIITLLVSNGVFPKLWLELCTMAKLDVAWGWMFS